MNNTIFTNNIAITETQQMYWFWGFLIFIGLIVWIILQDTKKPIKKSRISNK